MCLTNYVQSQRSRRVARSCSYEIFRFPSALKRVALLATIEWLNANVCSWEMRLTMLALVWDPPPFEQVKLNVDGSRYHSLGKIGAGGCDT